MSYRTFEILDRDAVDDFGDQIVPFKIQCVDDYGNLIGYWDFAKINYIARYEFLKHHRT